MTMSRHSMLRVQACKYLYGLKPTMKSLGQHGRNLMGMEVSRLKTYGHWVCQVSSSGCRRALGSMPQCMHSTRVVFHCCAHSELQNLHIFNCSLSHHKSHLEPLTWTQVTPPQVCNTPTPRQKCRAQIIRDESHPSWSMLRLWNKGRNNKGRLLVLWRDMQRFSLKLMNGCPTSLRN